MIASGVFAGVFTRDWAAARSDREGMTLGAALETIGYRGAARCGDHPLSAFFELHIEQGPILEVECRDIGVVTGVQAMRWYDATITGQDAHTGTTPMHLRRNALLGAARLIERVDAIAHGHAPQAVGTVGLIENRPNSRNVIPGEVFCCIDLRHPDDQVLDVMEHELTASLDEVCRPLGLSVDMQKIWHQPAVHFDPECIAAVRHAAAQTGFSARDMVSGAGHDAAYIARVAPAAMIFVPCRGGISHNEAEFTSKEQCAAGADVLLHAVLEFDRRLAERSGTRR
jgi:N-carbamoyl-L-amino-acid hydrolase